MESVFGTAGEPTLAVLLGGLHRVAPRIGNPVDGFA
jgi:hypothetical protein